MGDGYMSITVLYANSYPPFYLVFFHLVSVQKIVLNGVIFNSVGPPPLVRSAIYMTSASPGFPSPPLPPCAFYPRLSLLHPQPRISRVSVILLGTVPLNQTLTSNLSADLKQFFRCYPPKSSEHCCCLTSTSLAMALSGTTIAAAAPGSAVTTTTNTALQLTTTDNSSAAAGQKRSTTAAGNTNGSSFRPVKRRASKACQCCRARKVRCNVVEHGAPCTNCRLDEVECIITESKRRK